MSEFVIPNLETIQIKELNITSVKYFEWCF